jgi:hypothetical protein
MENQRWLRCDRLMRWSHLYTGLFLVPWMVVYALSAFFLNHAGWFTETLKIAPEWQMMREEQFAADASFPQNPAEQVEALLARVELTGPHKLQGDGRANPMTIYRFCGTGHYRVTWHRLTGRLVVEKQHPFSFYSLVNTLHFQHGYTQPYLAHLAWAIVVDAVTLSTVIWVFSGIYLWARRPRRLLGAVCLAAGTLLFVGLALLLCR